MKKQEQPTHEIITGYLTECKKHIDAEVYYKALNVIRDAKFADTRNIYIIALEKQVKLLSDLSKKHPGLDAHKKKICETLPEIIRRAIDDSRKREELRTQDTQREEDSPIEDNPYVRERELALKKLKNQFVKVAEEYIDKGDYQSALEEIRRIFIIDPENTIAHNLEKKIEALVNFRNKEVEKKTTVKKKKKTSRFGKVLPFLIAILVFGNLGIYYATTGFSGGKSRSAEIVYSFATDYNFADSYDLGVPIEGESEEQIGPPVPLMVSLPDELIRYRNTISVLYEIEEYTPENYRPDTGGLNMLTAYETYAQATTDDSGSMVDTIDEMSQNPNALVLVDEPDVVVHLETPIYPAEAYERGIEGDVVVRVLFDSAGSVNVSFVESSDHPLLSDSALQSARKSQFQQSDTTESDSPQWVTIPYRYRIIR
jgi:TonB family protein